MLKSSLSLSSSGPKAANIAMISPSAQNTSHVVSPLDYGADPTGVQDSSEAFALAIAAAIALGTSVSSYNSGTVEKIYESHGTQNNGLKMFLGWPLK